MGENNWPMGMTTRDIISFVVTPSRGAWMLVGSKFPKINKFFLP